MGFLVRGSKPPLPISRGLGECFSTEFRVEHISVELHVSEALMTRTTCTRIELVSIFLQKSLLQSVCPDVEIVHIEYS